jgi:WhiB family redox-sensing transcriptional regulator
MSEDLDVLMPWRKDGNCVGMDRDLFFPDSANVAPEAVEACASCPVLAECREWAIHHEDHGYWAGMSERARRKLRRVLKITLDDDHDDTGDTAA